MPKMPREKLYRCVLRVVMKNSCKGLLSAICAERPRAGGWLCPSGYIWQCLEMFLLQLGGERRSGLGIQWAEARNTAEHHFKGTTSKDSPHTKCQQSWGHELQAEAMELVARDSQFLSAPWGGHVCLFPVPHSQSDPGSLKSATMRVFTPQTLAYSTNPGHFISES